MDSNSELAKLMEEHRPKLLRMLENRIDPSLRRRIDPEDVLTDAFLKASGQWEEILRKGAIPPFAFIYQQTREALIAAWRRHSGATRDARMDLPCPEHSAAAMAMGFFGSGTSPSLAARRKESVALLKDALDNLKDSHREVLMMRHFDVLSFKEVAEALGIAQDNARQRYVRALERLREELERAGLGRDDL
jgi:RNA polymerase sigma-70 factor (ECF subfamily)